ncbi:MAG: NlpC/P60 family protein [Henriciella sp.]|uniref:C40 family peptidase n=1 Tax=Henriciella sp. TaxID=1968823 RepID=UPI003C769CC9
MLAARADLADAALAGQVAAERFAEGVDHVVSAPLLDLTLSSEPDSEIASQVLHGERFTVFDISADGLAWGRSWLDGYVGHVSANGLRRCVRGEPPPAARVAVLSSHAYARPDVKSPVRASFPFLAHLAVTGFNGAFAALADGTFVPAAHLEKGSIGVDAADIALRFLGVPYLWGGRSAAGIDCSGLVQAAFSALGEDAPRDTDMQEAWLGAELSQEAASRRGDLVFWAGHVGIMTDETHLVHANATHMAVVEEPLADAVARIAAAGSGDITSRRRVGSAQ